jgi:UDP-N-acetylglucosamine--N-acetylmuramyl-(pentapeptide) pyrophosphoryl-undecaprenol N-acetylglucosamine transferase
MTGPVILAAGGTGGHMFPAEALAGGLLARGLRVVLITDQRGGAFGDHLPDVQVERIRAASPGGGLLGKLKAAVELFAGTAQARALLTRLRPSAIVGFGGYPSVPTVYAGQRLGIPTLLHEQNAVLGRANRLLAGRATAIATSFPAVTGLPAKTRRIHTGNPVRSGILALADQPYPTPTANGPLGLLVTGGSQGAAVFGSIIPNAIALLPEDQRLRLSIVQQARHETMADAHAVYDRLGVQAEIAPFFRDMPDRLSRCHLVIGRAGASTVAELAVAGRPAILIPYPHATDDHQTANALALTATGGGWVLPQAGFSAETLAARLHELMKNPDQLTQAAARARAWAIPDAATRLADAVEMVAGLQGANGNHSPDQQRAAE